MFNFTLKKSECGFVVLCICCSLCLEETSSELCITGSFVSFRSLLKWYFFKKHIRHTYRLIYSIHSLALFYFILFIISIWNYLCLKFNYVLFSCLFISCFFSIISPIISFIHCVSLELSSMSLKKVVNKKTQVSQHVFNLTLGKDC